MPASIFGVAAPKFIYGETEVELDHIIVTKDEPDLDDIEHKSIINGFREWDKKGKHWVFEVDVYLWKYDNPLTTYQSLKTYEFNLVELYKRRDGSSIKNENDDVVYFFIESMEELYREHYLYPDVLRITFVSKIPIDIPVSNEVPIVGVDPRELPNFLAGYYANRISDDPPGSIAGSSSGAWFEINNISSSVKQLTGNVGYNLTSGQINGMNCFKTGGTSTSRLRNNPEDILNGLTNFTVIMLIKRESVSSGSSIFFTHMLTSNANQFLIFHQIDGKLGISMYRFSNAAEASAVTENSYANEQSHIVVAQFNQSNKSVRLIVNGTEEVTDTEANYISQILNSNLDCPIIGTYTSSTTTYRFNGLMGDIIFFDTIVSDEIINKTCLWIKDRFNANWTNI